MDNFLYNTLLQEFGKRTIENINVPLFLSNNLNQSFKIRGYQKEAFQRFMCYFENSFEQKKLPIHLLYNMATGSGKTFVMAGLILYLYEQGYRNFLFFVNSNNIIDKTKANFLNSNSSKYLFNDKITFDGKLVNIKEVSNFTTSKTDDIQIKFTTIQGLHSDLITPKENGLTYEDFEDQKIVILSDEAHHINSTTKKGKLNKTENEAKESWENTVLKMLNSHKENIMLEFTATIDLSNEFIKEKYIDKIIYKYDLKEFRLDGYSKEVDILKSDMEQKDRILQALLLSQYRLKVAERYNIICKPVILFKAQKTVAESEENLQNFNELIKELSKQDILIIKQKANGPLLKSVFDFFESRDITIDDLIRELKEDFGEDKCLSANDNKEVEKVQMLLNTLEDKTNQIRAVFAVQKLNEGRDVLNLFDIVRLYESRDGKRNKNGKYVAGNGTMSEAQLIGRGARYFPYNTKEAMGEDKYKRKFDRTNHDLKILETFYYHTSFDNKYITEIKQALREIGMMDEKERKPFKLKLKDSFTEKSFYKEGVIYTNSKKEKLSDGIDSLEMAGLSERNFDIELTSGINDIITVFEEKTTNSDKKQRGEAQSVFIKKINKNIVRKAIGKNDFYRFDNLKKYIGCLQSMDEFMTDEKYLGNIKINFLGSQETLKNIDNEQKLKAISSILKQLESTIKSQKIQYEGTRQFEAKSIRSIFHKEKDIFVDLGAEEISKDKDRFVFEKIVGTSEEKEFIELFGKKVEELKKKYDEIYLLRSERAFAIYSFDKGERFEPDFVLFLKKSNNQESITYQVFIEPKGNQFKDSEGKFGVYSKEGRKQKFLLEISEKTHIMDFNFGNYKLIGLPLYNKQLENEFEKVIDEKLL